MIEVNKAGALVTLQDRGRKGCQHTGYAQGGALDEHAALWANYLLGNPIDVALIEASFSPLVLTFKCSSFIAITGADVGARINGQPISSWSSYQVHAGDVVSLGWPKRGIRAYVAVAGGILTKTQFESRSCVVREGDPKVTAGDWLPIAQVESLRFRQGHVPSQFQRLYPTPAETEQQPCKLRLIAGYQCDFLTEDQRHTLVNHTYMVANESDRMGYRMTGPALGFSMEGLASEAIALGAVQIPADGQPIVLLKDRQTLGGYPKVGCVLSLDTFALAQLVPGCRVQFEWISVAEAQAIQQAFYGFFMKAKPLNA